MNQSSTFKDTIRHQFERLCQLALKGEAVNCFKHMDYRRRNEISFTDLTVKELEKFYKMDEYTVENRCFKVLGYDIEVKDDLIAEALKELPQKKRDIVLLSFFMEMSDADIAREMCLVRSTIHEHKKRSMEMMKGILERMMENES